jgi:hypothetical protein
MGALLCTRSNHTHFGHTGAYNGHLAGAKGGYSLVTAGHSWSHQNPYE